MPRNWEHAAGILWPALVEAAESKRQINYGDLAPLINTNPLSVGHALGPIQTYCLSQKLPPLTVLVVGKSSGEPGDGFIAWDVDNLEAAFEQVYSFNWSALFNPFEGYGPTDTTESFAQRLIQNPEESESIYAQVRVRGNMQRIFRQALLEAYEYQCAICECSFEEVLEAAHIVPWASSDNSMRISPNNGILLCSNHHRLFDSGYIIISDLYRIKFIDEEFDPENYSEADLALSVNVDGRRINLPESPNLYPSRELLSKRCKG